MNKQAGEMPEAYGRAAQHWSPEARASVGRAAKDRNLSALGIEARRQLQERFDTTALAAAVERFTAFIDPEPAWYW